MTNYPLVDSFYDNKKDIQRIVHIFSYILDYQSADIPKCTAEATISFKDNFLCAIRVVKTYLSCLIKSYCRQVENCLCLQRHV